jgi:NAD(P)-dependent dehydrogenase (short-subunit alcohol dehydrogenase family)
MTRTAIITGASSGIGAAAATLFIDAGFSVVNISRRPCPVNGVTDLCGDLSDPESVKELAHSLTSHITEIQPTSVCLVHNAALMLKDSATDTDDALLAEVLQINTLAINHLNRELLPLMPSGSSVLFVGSTLSEKAVKGAFSYVVSKHAQLGMMRATCQDLMGRGIHTALVCPGFTDTEMLRNHIGQDEEIIRAISAMNSFGRLVEPEEIARLIVWAHDNPVINGAVLHGNLGQVEH